MEVNGVQMLLMALENLKNVSIAFSRMEMLGEQDVQGICSMYFQN